MTGEVHQYQHKKKRVRRLEIMNTLQNYYNLCLILQLTSLYREKINWPFLKVATSATLSLSLFFLFILCF